MALGNLGWVAEDQDIGLDDVGVGELDVDRGDKGPARATA
jgi:hypothetical protein